MFNSIKNHIFTLHEKIGLVVAYGIIMFLMGMGLNSLFTNPLSDISPAAGSVGEDVPQGEAVSTDEVFAPVRGAGRAPIAKPGRGRDVAGLGPRDMVAMEVPLDIAVAEGMISGDDDGMLSSAEDLGVADVDEGVTEEEILQDGQYSEFIYDLVVKKGDTFTNILEKAGVPRQDAYEASKVMGKEYNLRGLRIGQKMQAVFREVEPGSGEEGELEFVVLRLDEPERVVELARKDKGFEVRVLDKVLLTKMKFARGSIRSSLYVLASKLNIPHNILIEAINAYSFDIDFQRDIRKGTQFEVLYEEIYDEQGKKVRDGNLVYAGLTVDNNPIKIYRFAPPDGDKSDVDYYTEDGRTLRRSLMKTPINGAVISSPFGKRRHPISGYTKMHKGVDFAAPRGTPVFAAGTGKIVKIGRNGGYGNYIRIRHNSEYNTAYGHLHKFAKGMRRGRKVRQGQVIAYVGSTGASTGPHLHYEILRGETQVNPMRVNMPPGKKLSGASMGHFEARRSKIDEQINAIVSTHLGGM